MLVTAGQPPDVNNESGLVDPDNQITIFQLEKLKGYLKGYVIQPGELFAITKSIFFVFA